MRSTICMISGILSPIVAFSFIALAIATHPWFSFTKNALSDLGALGRENSWIFNLGLIAGGILAIIFSSLIQGKGENVLENAAYFLFLIASVLMLLIGVFPEGTGPHFTVSALFYLLSAISILSSGAGFIMAGKSMEGVGSILIVATALLLSFGVKWGGIAVPESIGAIGISLWIYMLIFAINICKSP